MTGHTHALLLGAGLVLAACSGRSTSGGGGGGGSSDGGATSAGESDTTTTDGADGSDGGTSATGTGAFEPELERYAADQCAIIMGCDCEDPLYASMDECIEELMARLAPVGDLARADGLAWSQACADAKLERLSALCAPVFDEALHCNGEHCGMFAGDVPEAGSCTELRNVPYYPKDAGSDCAPGFGCPSYASAFGCVQVCGELPEGSECPLFGSYCEDGFVCVAYGIGFTDPATCEPAAGQGEECSTLEGPTCGPGLVCGPGTCVPEPEPGEPCGQSPCSAGSFCNDEGLCELPRANDDPCRERYHCASGCCASSVCKDRPGEGDPCGANCLCAEGLRCNVDSNTCEVSPPILCRVWHA